MKDLKNRRYRFDEVEVDVQNLRVTVGSEIRPLEPKAFRLLLFLIENPGRVLPKEEIMAVVWPDVFVSDNSLARAITQIRKALADDPKAPRYIVTVPTVGYRFAGDCKEEHNQPAGSDASDRGTPAVVPMPAAAPSRVGPNKWAGIRALPLLAARSQEVPVAMGSSERRCNPGDRLRRHVAGETALAITPERGGDSSDHKIRSRGSLALVFTRRDAQLAFSSNRSGRYQIYVRSTRRGRSGTSDHFRRAGRTFNPRGVPTGDTSRTSPASTVESRLFPLRAGQPGISPIPATRRNGRQTAAR